MEFSRWLPWYERIASKFGYDMEKDRQAARMLRNLLSESVSPLGELKKMFENKHVIVFGAGPSLENNISEFVSNGLEKSFALVAADGATTAFLNQSLIPQVVVTDLDGKMEDIIEASKLGSAIIIHAHGDNMDAMKKWIPRILEKRRSDVFGTTQVEPIPPTVHNFGGFTDGDRAAFLVEEMNPKTITLAGMNLGKIIGMYSKNRTRSFRLLGEKSKWLADKRAKLQFAKELLEWLATWSRTRGGLFNATGPKGETIRGFNNIQFKELQKVVMSTE